MSDKLYLLVASSNSGRFALGDPDGRDLTSGDHIEIFLGGHYIPGRVEHTGNLIPIERTLGEAMNQSPQQYLKGYHFISDLTGNICGLCVGMRVRLP